MTIGNPPISNVGADVVAQSIRRLATSQRNGPGRSAPTDLTVSGDASTMAFHYSTGGYWVALPDGTFDLVYANAADVVSGVTADPSGTRRDAIYARIRSEEFVDATNLCDIIYVQNNFIGATQPLVVPSVGGGYGKLAEVLVPATATKGTDCTITNATDLSYASKPGGIGVDDIASGVLPVITNQTVHFGGTGTANTAHGAPFIPRLVVPIPTGPINAGPYALLHAVSTIDASNFASQWVMSDNTFPSGFMSVRVIAYP